MTDTMRHEQIEQLLPAAALEILEGEELVQVTSHVQECADCARLLDSYREAVAGLSTTLPAHPLQLARSARVRARLLERARRSVSLASGVASRTRRARAAVDRWAGWAVAAGLAGILLVHHSIHRPVAYGWLVAGALIFIVLALGMYIRTQRARVSALEERLSALSEGRSEEASLAPNGDRTPPGPLS